MPAEAPAIPVVAAEEPAVPVVAPAAPSDASAQPVAVNPVVALERVVIRGNADSYDLGPIPEFYVSDANNNDKRDSGSEFDDERSPDTPPPRRRVTKRRRLDSEASEQATAASNSTETATMTEPRETTSQGTQTAGLSDAYGWDHHHTIVRETRRNGAVVVTEDFIWRAGIGSVKFPCCETAASYKQ